MPKRKRRGLGWRKSKDDRDRLFTVVRRPVAPGVTYRYWWQAGWWGDQGTTSQCVAYSWAHWLEDGPITQPDPAPILKPSVIYRNAQRIDEWPGEDYLGTSVRAGAKVLRNRGFITEFHRAFTVADIENVLLTQGPMCVGTAWHEGFDLPDGITDRDDALISEITGPMRGGHAYVINGVNRVARIFRMKNSWGRAWARSGNAFMTYDVLEQLLADDGEAWIAVEKGVAA